MTSLFNAPTTIAAPRARAADPAASPRARARAGDVVLLARRARVGAHRARRRPRRRGRRASTTLAHRGRADELAPAPAPSRGGGWTSGGSGGAPGARQPDAAGYTTAHTKRCAASASRAVPLPPTVDVRAGGAETWVADGQVHVALPKGAPAPAPAVRDLPVGTSRLLSRA